MTCKILHTNIYQHMKQKEHNPIADWFNILYYDVLQHDMCNMNYILMRNMEC